MSRTPSPLTDRELSIIRYIAAYQADRGFAPGIRDIGAAIGVDSTSLVHWYIGRLERAGLLTRTPRTARSLIISERGRALIEGRQT